MKNNSESEFMPEGIGHKLGFEGVKSVVGKVEAYCDCERQFIELSNQPKVLALRAEISFLVEREQALKNQLRQAPPTGDLGSRRRKAWYCFGITMLLTVAGFIFSVLAFDPYRLGLKSLIYCLGIAVVTPYCTAELLDRWASERLIKMLVAVSFAAALASLVLLAVIRGDLMMQQVEEVGSLVILDGESTPPSQDANAFYKDTIPLLRLVMALLAVAMELGAGLALYDAQRLWSSSVDDCGRLAADLQVVQGQMAARLQEMASLRNEAAVFVARFWRDFYRAMVTHTIRSAITKLILLVMVAASVANAQDLDREAVNLVVLVDLTASVGSKGYDNQTEFGKNLVAVSRLLAQVPAGSKVTILGITDESFSRPYILISAVVPTDAGYFGERLTAAKRELMRLWKAQSAQLEPRARRSDILGALIVAGEIFQQNPSEKKKVLVVFSDMRHMTAELNLEAPGATSLDIALAIVERHKLIADLNGVELYVLGVSATGRNTGQWEELRQFWIAYFRETGTTLKRYSLLREQTRPRL